MKSCRARSSNGGRLLWMESIWTRREFKPIYSVAEHIGKRVESNLTRLRKLQPRLGWTSKPALTTWRFEWFIAELQHSVGGAVPGERAGLPESRGGRDGSEESHRRAGGMMLLTPSPLEQGDGSSDSVAAEEGLGAKSESRVLRLARLDSHLQPMLERRKRPQSQPGSYRRLWFLRSVQSGGQPEPRSADQFSQGARQPATSIARCYRRSWRESNSRGGSQRECHPSCKQRQDTHYSSPASLRSLHSLLQDS